MPLPKSPFRSLRRTKRWKKRVFSYVFFCNLCRNFLRNKVKKFFFFVELRFIAWEATKQKVNRIVSLTYHNYVHPDHMDSLLRHHKHVASSCIDFRHSRSCHCRIFHSLIRHFDPNSRHDRHISNRMVCTEYYYHMNNLNKLHTPHKIDERRNKKRIKQWDGK